MIKVTVKENREVDINQWLPFSCPCKTTIYEWYIFILQLHVHYRKVKNRCESDALIPCQPETGLLAYFSRGAAWIWWQLQFVYWANMNLNVSFVVILILPWGLLEFITIIFFFGNSSNFSGFIIYIDKQCIFYEIKCLEILFSFE